MVDVLERLKVLIDSSTPIVVMETVEEMRAVRLVRAASSPLNLAVFEWSIASGLIRCGSDTVVHEYRVPGGFPGSAHNTDAAGAAAIYNSQDPAQALGNLEALSIKAVYILKDFHRHIEDPVVIRRLRDVGQKFSMNRRTIVITAPAFTVPPELRSLVDFVELPELIRKGRFDELFFVDLPNRAERKQIFTIQLAKHGRSAAEFDLEKLAAGSNGFLGAEIEAAVQSGLYAAFASKPALRTETILAALARTVPLSTTRAEEIQGLRIWAKQRAVPACAPAAVGASA